jgi:hypothetical protein
MKNTLTTRKETEEVGASTAPTVPPSKPTCLSQAIRQGAALRPQVYSDYFRVAYRDHYAETYTIGSCTWGAAMEAHSGVPAPQLWQWSQAKETYLLYANAWTAMLAAFSLDGTQLVRDPWGTERMLFEVIGWLNDEKRWTREAIADWAESEGL